MPEKRADRRQTPPCQLYLVIEVHQGARDLLTAVLARMPVASVLFQPTSGAKLSAAAVKPLIDLAQSKNVAALLLDDIALARSLRADGVHLSAGEDVVSRYHEAREVLGSRAIVGADAGGSRHVGMELGEAGADYVAFGAVPPLASIETDDTIEADLAGPFDQLGLVAWWSAVFEVPCVASGVDTAAAAAEFAAAGADFIAVKIRAAEPLAAALDALQSIVRGVEHADV